MPTASRQVPQPLALARQLAVACHKSTKAFGQDGPRDTASDVAPKRFISGDLLGTERKSSGTLRNLRVCDSTPPTEGPHSPRCFRRFTRDRNPQRHAAGISRPGHASDTFWLTGGEKINC